MHCWAISQLKSKKMTLSDVAVDIKYHKFSDRQHKVLNLRALLGCSEVLHSYLFSLRIAYVNFSNHLMSTRKTKSLLKLPYSN